MACTICHGNGWVLDGDLRVPPRLELIPCPVPDCAVSGQHVDVLSLNARWHQPAIHPTTGHIMSIQHDPLT